jgi:molybdenum cofactor biosynthesis enzyme MoaA
MLSEMEREGILYSVALTGGEPLLFKEFSSLCEVLRKHDIKFLTMNTNGTYLKDHLQEIDGLFDFIDISRHSISDKNNSDIFSAEVPTIEELKYIKNSLKKTKVRIQCVMYEIKSIENLLNFVDVFKFADDISFRRLMELPEKYGVKYNTDDELYFQILEYAYNHFKFVEQTIQDYYVYEIWNYNGLNITFSYSNMNMLSNLENIEDNRVCREFIIHPNGIISGSWDFNNKVICK